jgi:hypothetical protein
VGPLFRRGVERQGDRVRAAVRGAVSDMVAETVEDVRDDIRAAGRFGARWTDGFQGKVTEGGGNIRVAYTEAVSYWKIQQFGGVIHGRPLLWIPLSGAGVPPGTLARDYSGGLFRTTRKRDGLPLLGSLADGSMKFFGKTSVYIRPKFHIIQIIRAAAQKLQDLYRDRMKNG